LRDNSDQTTARIDDWNAPELIVFHQIQRLFDVTVGSTRDQISRHQVGQLRCLWIPTFGHHLENDVAVGNDPFELVIIADDRDWPDVLTLHQLRRLLDEVRRCTGFRILCHYITARHFVLLLCFIMIALIAFDRLTGLLLVSRTLLRASAFGSGSRIEHFPETVRCRGSLSNRSADG
jgi:hypothetical protein